MTRLEGRWTDSEALLAGALEEERATGSNWDVAALLLQQGSLDRISGQFEAAESALLQSIEMTAGEHLQFEFDARTELALVYADTGRSELANPHLARCREIVAVEDFGSGAGFLTRAEGAIAALTGRSNEANELLAKSATIFRKYHMPFEEAEANIYAARAALVGGFSERAARQLDTAVEIYRGIGTGQRWIDRVEAARQLVLTAGDGGQRNDQSSVAGQFRK